MNGHRIGQILTGLGLLLVLAALVIVSSEFWGYFLGIAGLVIELAGVVIWNRNKKV